ncbi:MAG: hypothetical protein M3Q16_10295 [Pseudomonadota bacterium]|nr:hypothetical protein [Pseudomonadota bacterium]
MWKAIQPLAVLFVVPHRFKPIKIRSSYFGKSVAALKERVLVSMRGIDTVGRMEGGKFVGE